MTTKLDETFNNRSTTKKNLWNSQMPLCIRGLVVFPGMSVQFDVGRKNHFGKPSLMDINQTVFLVLKGFGNQ